jgi:hypothetical protein
MTRPYMTPALLRLRLLSQTRGLSARAYRVSQGRRHAAGIGKRIVGTARALTELLRKAEAVNFVSGPFERSRKERPNVQELLRMKERNRAGKQTILGNDVSVRPVAPESDRRPELGECGQALGKRDALCI